MWTGQCRRWRRHDRVQPGHARRTQWAMGLRLLFTRPEQRSDAELEALAGQHIHAHNTDYNLNASVGMAYGVTHHLTLSAELPYVRREGLREGEHSHEAGPRPTKSCRSATCRDRRSEPARQISADRRRRRGLRRGRRNQAADREHRRDQPRRRAARDRAPAGDRELGPARRRVGVAAAWRWKPDRQRALSILDDGGAAHPARRPVAGRDCAVAPLRRGRTSTEPEHHHPDDGDRTPRASPRPSAGAASWDAFVELAGEWEGRQTIDGEVEADSGGAWRGSRRACASMRPRAGARRRRSRLPVWQDIRASHPDNRYRLMLSLGRAF